MYGVSNLPLITSVADWFIFLQFSTDDGNAEDIPESKTELSKNRDTTDYRYSEFFSHGSQCHSPTILRIQKIENVSGRRVPKNPLKELTLLKSKP